MKHTLKHRRLGALAATLGSLLALSGGSYAVAQAASDSRSSGASAVPEPAGISPVIGKSFITYTSPDEPTYYTPLPATAPKYSQVNFLTPPYWSPESSAGIIKTAQGAGQMHVEAAVQLRKMGSPADSHVTCDVRIDGSDGSRTYQTTVTGANTVVTIPLVGHKAGLAAGDHNAGVRCWASGGAVYMHEVDLHAVVYGASVPS